MSTGDFIICVVFAGMGAGLMWFGLYPFAAFAFAIFLLCMVSIGCFHLQRPLPRFMLGMGIPEDVGPEILEKFSEDSQEPEETKEEPHE